VTEIGMKAGKEELIPGELYHSSSLSGVFTYLAEYPILENDTLLGRLYVELKASAYKSAGVYPELLLEEKDKMQRDVWAKAFKADLKNRIDETAKYIRPREGTMDYAFMFIPSEAIYYDLLINKVGMTNTSARDLIEYAFRDKKVIIVSPTTFMAYLQTVMQGLRALQIEEQAKEIQQRVGELGRHIATYEQFMQKLGGSLGTTVSHYNNAHKELKKIDKDVVKIADSSPAVEPLLLDKPNLEEAD